MPHQQPHPGRNVKLSIKSSQIGTDSFSRQEHSVSPLPGKAVKLSFSVIVIPSSLQFHVYAIPRSRPVSVLHHLLEFAQIHVH